MHETYRMLGREHEADLEREARKLDLAAGRAEPGARVQATSRQRPWRIALLRYRLAAFRD